MEAGKKTKVSGTKSGVGGATKTTMSFSGFTKSGKIRGRSNG
jgi:hypothetical protein